VGKGMLVLLILALIAVALGVGYYFYYGAKPLNKVMRPEVKNITSSWGTVTSDTTEVVTSIVMYNPNSFSIPVKSILSTYTCTI